MPRYIVELPMSFRCHISADHSAAAVDEARKVMLNVHFGDAIKKVVPAEVHAQVVYTSGAPRVGDVAIPEITGISDPDKRLRAIYGRCFKHNGPRLPFDATAAKVARAAYAEIPEGPAKLRAHAAFDDFGVDLGVAICAPAIFTGEWFGYERETYALGLRGYDSGQRWNGWACPLLTLKSMKAIVTWQRKLDKESLAGMDQIVISTEKGVSKVWMQYCADNGGELVEIRPSTHQTEDGPRELYGAGDGWCWEAFASKRDAKFKKLVG